MEKIGHAKMKPWNEEKGLRNDRLVLQLNLL